MNLPKDLLIVACITIAVLLAVFAPIAALIEFSEWRACANYQAMTGKATKRITLDACYVQTDSGWQRWDEYKARAVASRLQ